MITTTVLSQCRNGTDLFNASVDLNECGNFQTAMVKYRYKIDPIQAIYVKSVYSTPQY